MSGGKAGAYTIPDGVTTIDNDLRSMTAPA